MRKLNQTDSIVDNFNWPSNVKYFCGCSGIKNRNGGNEKEVGIQEKAETVNIMVLYIQQVVKKLVEENEYNKAIDTLRKYSQETSISFYQKAFSLASDNLEPILNSYLSHPESLQIQDHSQKTYFPKFTKDSAQIDWSWNLDKIDRFIRALNPWPVAWTYIKNQQDQTLKMKIISSKIEKNNLIPIQVQIEGKKTTSWSEIQNYYQILY